VWVLVKDDRKLLSPAKDALGTAGTKLVEPLLELVDKVGVGGGGGARGGVVGGRWWWSRFGVGACQSGGPWSLQFCLRRRPDLRLSAEPQHPLPPNPARASAQGDGETEAGEDGDGDDADGGARPEGAVAVDNGDSALLLLRALANQDEAVAKLLKGEEGLLANRSCAIM
jgi:hypothetical protein